MNRHILIPTDGSELSQNAIDYGMALAKSVNAKVTVLTVSMPFQTFAVEPGLVTDTSKQYVKRMASLAAKYLGGTKILRFDCHGFAWPARNFRSRARE